MYSCSLSFDSDSCEQYYINVIDEMLVIEVSTLICKDSCVGDVFRACIMKQGESYSCDDTDLFVVHSQFIWRTYLTLGIYLFNSLLMWQIGSFGQFVRKESSIILRAIWLSHPLFSVFSMSFNWSGMAFANEGTM